MDEKALLSTTKKTHPMVNARMTKIANPEMVALAMAPTIAQGTAVAAFVASSEIETAESKLPIVEVKGIG